MPKPKSILECPHLGEKVGDTKLKKTGCGCGQAKVASVFECDVHEYCSPFGNRRLIDEAITDCGLCGKYLEESNGSIN